MINMKLKKLFKSCPKLYSIILLLYQYLYKNVVTGYYGYMIFYILKLKNKELCQLKSKGLTQIIPYKTLTWRRGKGLDRAFRRYYLAKFNGNDCFVKVAENDQTIQNEIDVAERIHNTILPFIPYTYVTDKCFGENKKMIVFSYQNGLHLIPDNITEGELKQLCREFVIIHHALNDLNLVHADIHKKNLMLDGKNHLFLLDFGISRFLDSNNEVNYIARPGTFFIETPAGRKYDDAFSFLKMLNCYSSCKNIIESNEYKSIVNLVGKSCFEVSFKE